MAAILPPPKLRFFDANGSPLAGGKLFTYAAGTSTLQATYTDQAQSGTNANPVILDANGEASVWIGTNPYKFVLKTSADVTLWTVDGVSQIENGAVLTAKLADGAVTTVKIADSNVTTSKIADSNVTTAKIADSNITTAKIADGAVTRPKLAALGQQLSSSCGLYTTTSTSWADVTNLSVTITTTGRPVMLKLVADGSGNTSYVYFGNLNNGIAAALGHIGFYRSTTNLADLTTGYTVNVSSASRELYANPAGYSHVDVVSAGTYTYKVSALCATGVNININYVKLLAFEL